MKFILRQRVVGNRLSCLVILQFFLWIVVACGGKEQPAETVYLPPVVKASTPDKVAWHFTPKAIRLNIRASTDLNSSDGQAHTVLLSIYQLSEPSSFMRRGSTRDGLVELLAGETKDPAIMSMDKQVIAPGQSLNLVYDRVEKSRYVGMVAGYDNLDVKTSLKVWNIPVEEVQEGVLWGKERYFIPGVFEGAVLLGSRSIQSLEGL